MAPPSFGRAGGRLFGEDPPWWELEDTSEPEEPGEPEEPAEAAEPGEAEDAGEPEDEPPAPPRIEKSVPDIQVAGPGALSIDTRGAVPLPPPRPTPGLTSTDPDGIPVVTPDAVLPPGVPPAEAAPEPPAPESEPEPGPTWLAAPAMAPAAPPGLFDPRQEQPWQAVPMPAGTGDAGGAPGGGQAVSRWRRPAVLSGLVAVGVVGAVAGLAVLGGGAESGDQGPRAAEPTATRPNRPAPPPRVDIGSVKTDPRPLTLQEAFGAPQARVGERTFLQDRTSVNHQCELAANGTMAAALRDGGCRSVVRATYINARKTLVVTTGIAVMPTRKAASKANDAGDPVTYDWFRGMAGDRTPNIDKAGGYALSTVRGHYIVYSYAMNADGAAPAPGDTTLKDLAVEFIGFSTRPINLRATGRP